MNNSIDDATERQERYHHENGSHPGHDWEWVTNTDNPQRIKKNSEFKLLIVGVAFMRDGSMMPRSWGTVSIWRQKK